MKKTIAALVIASMLAGCGHPATIQGKEYPTYGFLNADMHKSEKICYEISVGNVVWSIILSETLIAPVYFVGWSIFNPVGPKVDGKCGIDV